jgi:hypothetical protein
VEKPVEGDHSKMKPPTLHANRYGQPELTTDFTDATDGSKAMVTRGSKGTSGIEPLVGAHLVCALGGHARKLRQGAREVRPYTFLICEIRVIRG